MCKMSLFFIIQIELLQRAKKSGHKSAGKLKKFNCIARGKQSLPEINSLSYNAEQEEIKFGNFARIHNRYKWLVIKNILGNQQAVRY